MAYIEKTAFEARITNNEFNELVNVTGRFQTDGADDVCPAGFLCVRREQLPCAGFAGIKNENAWYMNAAAASVTANDVIYASNTYDVNLIQDPVTGNSYAIGKDTLGLPIPKGRDGTFTQIVFDNVHVYRFGEGNANAAVGSNKFFTIADGLLVPAAAAPTAVGAVYFELRGTGNFTVGTRSGFGYIDVVARKVSAGAATPGV